MSAPGRPKGEHLSAQREGSRVNPPGRPKRGSFERERVGRSSSRARTSDVRRRSAGAAVVPR
jgi:hypothetical protein